MARDQARPLESLIYVLVIVALALGLLICLGGVFNFGFGPKGIAGIIGALVCAAVLLSYGRSTRTRRTKPIAR